MADLQAVPGSAGPDVVRDQDKVMLVLSYLGILALIPFLTVKDSEYVKWHAKQGLALMAALIAADIAMFVLAFIPGIRMLNLLLGPIIGLGCLVLVIMGIIKALNGERWRIPVVSDIAAKF